MEIQLQYKHEHQDRNHGNMKTTPTFRQTVPVSAPELDILLKNYQSLPELSLLILTVEIWELSTDRYLNGKELDIAYVTAKVYHMKIEPTIHPQGVSSTNIWLWLQKTQMW
jgi:hypothetical protein